MTGTLTHSLNTSERAATTKSSVLPSGHTDSASQTQVHGANELASCRATPVAPLIARPAGSIPQQEPNSGSPLFGSIADFTPATMSVVEVSNLLQNKGKTESRQSECGGETAGRATQRQGVKIPRVELSNQDLKLLQILRAHGIINTEVAQLIYPTKSYKRLTKRLNKLTQCRLIQSTRPVYPGRVNLYKLTRQGHATIRDLFDEEQTRVSSSRNLSIGHELRVIEMRLRLETLWKGSFEVPSRPTAAQDQKPIPDGTHVFPSGRTIALEYEATLKSLPRYRKIFAHWDQQLTHQPPACVLYLASSAKIQESLKRIVEAIKPAIPVGVTLFENLKLRQPIWSLRGDLPLFNREEI